MLFNGKYTCAGMIVNPFAAVNDGLVDVTWIHDERVNGVRGIADLLGKAKKHGATHVYDRTTSQARGRKVTVKFFGIKGKQAPKGKGWPEQSFSIDGEEFKYKQQISFETLPKNLSVIFDSQKFFKQWTVSD